MRRMCVMQDPYVLYTVNAVFAAALGVDAALTDLCGEGYTGVCPNYRTNSTRSTATLEGIRAARWVAYLHGCHREMHVTINVCACRVTEMKKCRWACGDTLGEFVRNDNIRGRRKVGDITERCREAGLITSGGDGRWGISQRGAGKQD